MSRYFLVFVTICCLLTASVRSDAAGEDLHAAPSVERHDHGTGFVPPPMELSHVRLAEPEDEKIRDLPIRFDWREAGRVSPVKDQGNCGSCYAFAAAADLESRVLAVYDQLVLFSENHLKECHFEGSGCQGGNAFMMANLLTLQGAVLEDCDPYEDDDVGCTTDCEEQFAVLEWILLSGNQQPSPAALKQALTQHGPLSTTVYAGDDANPAWAYTFSSWSGGDGLYFADESDPNHAVVLVGWDDEHPHSGGGQGCWIVKNSWSENWGDACGYGTSNGYFYLAYDSASLGKWTTSITEVMPTYHELAVMAWDEGGWNRDMGNGSSTVTWGMARYSPAEESNLHQVEFWTTDVTIAVDVYVYDSFDGGTLGGLLDQKLGVSFDYPGYHFIALDEPLLLTPGNDYYVAVRFQNADYPYPLAVDMQGSRATARTWGSLDGSSWIDLSSTRNCTAGIRVRTSPHDVLPVSEPEEPEISRPPQNTNRFELEAPWPNPFNPQTSLAFTLDRPASIRLRIYDLQGRLISTVMEGHLPAGRHQTEWSGRDQAGRVMPAGVYHCRLDDGQRLRSQRLVLVK